MINIIRLLLATSLLFLPGISFAEPALRWADVRDRQFQAGFVDSFLPRKPINPSITGVNAFANDQSFGSIRSQFAEVKNTLRLRYVRVLFAWSDGVQPAPDSSIFWGFYDDIAANLPRGVEAIVVVNGLPSWMSSSKNWIDGDPAKTFVEKWARKVMARYRRNSKIKGFEIWNEPNDSANRDNVLLGLNTSPEKYVSLLSRAYTAARAVAPRKLVISAATTPPNQNYPRNLTYNRKMYEAGIESVADVIGMHYYGKNYENIIRPRGVQSFFRRLKKPVWVTESGARGVNKQREYVERTWPFLKQKIPGIARFYYYQFAENSPAATTYGLRNLTPGLTVSDLYIWLRDRS